MKVIGHKNVTQYVKAELVLDKVQTLCDDEFTYVGMQERQMVFANAGDKEAVFIKEKVAVA